LVELERPGGHHITGTNDPDWIVATAIGDPHHPAMPGGDPTLVAALQNGMGGDQGARFEDPPQNWIVFG